MERTGDLFFSCVFPVPQVLPPILVWIAHVVVDLGGKDHPVERSVACAILRSVSPDADTCRLRWVVFHRRKRSRRPLLLMSDIGPIRKGPSY